ncbi:MAG: protein kinase, partial [Deltaproteobacteria bacterium]|nr:protein kinase [Deltaproteobacteria bacterium]
MSITFPYPFGKYVLLNRIALGGMAEIFRAKTLGAEGFEKEMVIKRILSSYSEDEAFVKMFIDEAKIAAELHHANIVQIFDFDKYEDCYY